MTNPNGAHAIAVGLDAEAEVEIDGHVGYYCAGMNKHATVRVRGNAGAGVAENMMSGTVVVDGDASQSAGATGRGGLLVIRGSASARCGISMKGVEIVVHGSIGHAGRLHGPARARWWSAATRARTSATRSTRLGCTSAARSPGLGRRLHREGAPRRASRRARAAARAPREADFDPGEFRRYGSARKLYTFDIDNAGAY